MLGLEIMYLPTNSIKNIERELNNINRVKNIVKNFIKLYPTEMKFHTKTFFKGINKIAKKLKADKMNLKKH
jgi:hypothetical protein